MSSLKGLIGRKVIDRSNAEQVGKVSAVVLDTAGGAARFAALRIAGAGTEREFVDWSHVTGSGDDAVVVEGGDNLRFASGEREERVRAGDAELLGKRVLTDHGNEVGKVDDVEFDATSGTVEFVAAAAERIPGDRVRSVGPYALIVRCPHESSCPS